MSEESPLDEIRDPSTRDILRRVRDGNYFQLDIEAKRLENFIKKFPANFVEEFFKSRGVTVTDESGEGSALDTGQIENSTGGSGNGNTVSKKYGAWFRFAMGP